MADDDLHSTKLKAHVKAVEAHKSLLETKPIDSPTHMDEVKASLENLAITLEEYLKVIGIP
ncbi:MAG: hypothetical protein WBC07_03335 [Methylotenera sp.]